MCHDSPLITVTPSDVCQGDGSAALSTLNPRTLPPRPIIAWSPPPHGPAVTPTLHHSSSPPPPIFFSPSLSPTSVRYMQQFLVTQAISAAAAAPIWLPLHISLSTIGNSHLMHSANERNFFKQQRINASFSVYWLMSHGRGAANHVFRSPFFL